LLSHITESLKEKLSQDSLVDVQPLPGNEEMPLGDIMDNWYKSMADKEVDIPSELDISALDEAGLDTYSDSDSSDETYMPDPSKYQEFISKSPAYEWLLASLRQELLLISTHPNAREIIHEKILSILPSSSRISKRKSTAAINVTFRITWNPLNFVKAQGYKEKPDDVIERAITLTGSDKDAQALTCKEYLCQVWPSSGEDIVELVKNVVSSTPGQRHTCMSLSFCGELTSNTNLSLGDLSDGTKIVAWVQDLMLIVEALGTADSLAEIGEQLAWLGAALRSSPYDSGVASCVPSISDMGTTPSLVSGEITRPMTFISIDFHIEQKKNLLEVSNGQCWHNLFRNPVVVKGYPILRRSQPCTGLEISLKIMFALTQARFITTFGAKIFIKGFSTMLVPTKIERDMVSWHLLFNGDGSHISYTSPQIQKISGFYPVKVAISGLQTDRHIIGWCSNVQNHTGRTT
jgi:hypothetical protein